MEDKNNPKFGFIVSKAVYRDSSRKGLPRVLEIHNTVAEALTRLKELYAREANNSENSVIWQYIDKNPYIRGKFNRYYNNHEAVAYVTTAVVEVTKENAPRVKF